MVKGNPKSSASSATRKKHAKKHAAPEDLVPNTKGHKGGKKNKEPRVKMYIPPVKPAPVQPDPLETTGLAHSLPAELLVVLRNLRKKAQVTKVRALEDLQAEWVDKCLKHRDEATVYALVEMLPVWVSILYVISCIAVANGSLVVSSPSVTSYQPFSTYPTRRCNSAVFFLADSRSA
jgi:hypothetical protein